MGDPGASVSGFLNGSVARKISVEPLLRKATQGKRCGAAPTGDAKETACGESPCDAGAVEPGCVKRPRLWWMEVWKWISWIFFGGEFEPAEIKEISLIFDSRLYNLLTKPGGILLNRFSRGVSNERGVFQEENMRRRA